MQDGLQINILVQTRTIQSCAYQLIVLMHGTLFDFQVSPKVVCSLCSFLETVFVHFACDRARRILQSCHHFGDNTIL
jgi:hypothetical protein